MVGLAYWNSFGGRIFNPVLTIAMAKQRTNRTFMMNWVLWLLLALERLKASDDSQGITDVRLLEKFPFYTSWRGSLMC